MRGEKEGEWKNKDKSQNTKSWGQVEASSWMWWNHPSTFIHLAGWYHVTPLCLAICSHKLPWVLDVLQTCAAFSRVSTQTLFIFRISLTLAPQGWSISSFRCFPHIPFFCIVVASKGCSFDVGGAVWRPLQKTFSFLNPFHSEWTYSF